LHIEITERAPFVVWQYNGELRVVDRNGKPMDSVLASGVNVLLQVVGEGANTAALELVNQMEATPGLFSEVKAAVRLGNRRWNLMMKNGLRIELPEQDMETALKQADADYASGRLQQLPIQSVSYRFDGQVTYKAQSAMVLVPSDPATTSSLR